MTIVPIQQARKRFQTIPPSLQDSLFSVQTAEIIRLACKENYLPPEKNSEVARAVGLVLLGYIHAEDLAKEIEDDAKIAKEAAAAISDSISKKLFAPIRTELDNVYAPAPHDKELEESKPIIVKEIKKNFDQTSLGLTRDGQGKPLAPPSPGGGPIDLSKIFTSTSLSTGGAAPSAPKAPVAPSAAPKPADKPFGQAQGKPLSEFDRLGINKQAPAISNAELPTMLHKETETRPGEKVSGFKLEVPIPKFSETKTGSAQGKPAVLEFGLDKKLGSPPLSSAPRIVNYSNLRTPLPPVPPSKNPERELKEVTKEIKPFDATSLGLARDGQVKPPAPSLSVKPPLPEIKISAAPISATKPQNVFGGTGIKPIIPESKPPFLRFDMLQNKPFDQTQSRSSSVASAPFSERKPPLAAATPSIIKAEPPQPIGIYPPTFTKKIESGEKDFKIPTASTARPQSALEGVGIKPIMPGNKPLGLASLDSTRDKQGAPPLLGDEKTMHPLAGPSISGPGTRNFGQIPSPAPRPISPPAPIAPPRERIEPPPVRKPEPPAPPKPL